MSGEEERRRKCRDDEVSPIGRTGAGLSSCPGQGRQHRSDGRPRVGRRNVSPLDRAVAVDHEDRFAALDPVRSGHWAVCGQARGQAHSHRLVPELELTPSTVDFDCQEFAVSIRYPGHELGAPCQLIAPKGIGAGATEPENERIAREMTQADDPSIGAADCEVRCTVFRCHSRPRSGF